MPLTHDDKSPFPAMKTTSEIIDEAIEQGGLLMARRIVEAYESGGRFGYIPTDPGDPMQRVNRLLDTAVSRNRVVEQAGNIRDDIENFLRIIWPCKAHDPPGTPAVIRRMRGWAQDLTKVLVDATGD